MKGFIILALIVAAIVGAYFMFPDLKGLYTSTVNEKPALPAQ